MAKKKPEAKEPEQMTMTELAKENQQQLATLRKEEAGFVPVTIKFPVDLHRRLKVRSLDWRGRRMGSLAHACIQFVLDEIDAGRMPEAIDDAMNQVEGGGE